ncbi:hypothetical protein J6590_043998 [Homalodisca vitripennis]|nr:hypothetical protein J6590_043998 [Homalodisca vitripennis]
MAGGKNQTKCRSCSKNVTKSNKSIFCYGVCKSWYHIACVDISDEEFTLFLKLLGKAVFVCQKCREVMESATCTINSEAALEVNHHSTNDESLTCSSQIRILTDEILSITNNQKAITSELGRLTNENEMLKAAIKNQSEAITDIVLNLDNKDSYANKLKNNLTSGNLVSKDLSELCLVPGKHSQPVSITKPRTDAVGDVGHSLNCNYNKRIQFTDGLVDLTSTPKLSSALAYKEEDGEWLEVNSRSNRRSRPSTNVTGSIQVKPNSGSRGQTISDKTRNGSNGKKKFITGTAADDNLSVAEKKLFLFVSRLRPHIESKDLEKYIKDKKEADYIVEKLTSKFPQEYSSFKVGVPSSLYNEIYHSSFWPKNIYVTKFLTKRRTQAESLNEQLMIPLERT